jgi:hypothetical protein
MTIDAKANLHNRGWGFKETRKQQDMDLSSRSRQCFKLFNSVSLGRIRPLAGIAICFRSAFRTSQ